MAKATKKTKRKPAKKKATRSKMGRPSVWEDPRVEETILEALELGLSRRVAVNAAGISWDTFSVRVREEEDFSYQCLVKEAQGCLQHARTFRRASGVLRRGEKLPNADQVRAATVFLATHDREKWAKETRVKHSGKIGLAELMDGAREAVEDGEGDDE